MDNLPKPFVERMVNDLGVEEFREFTKALEEPQPVSIRLNPFRKGYTPPETPPVPWCAGAYYLNERPQFYKDPHIFGGSYYVQEASSMFIAHVYDQLELTENPIVADICAAPGGKSTLLASKMNGKGLLVSNELVGKRVVPLMDNLLRWGHANSVITSNRSENFSNLHEVFDLIAVDAPCSGEGMFRKDAGSVQQWSENLVKGCAFTQHEILTDILPAIKPGGYLVYSTCTYSKEENEDIISWLEEEYDVENIAIPIEEAWGIREVSVGATAAKGYRFMPHITKGEGLFMTVFRKTGEGRSNKKIKIPKKSPKPKFLTRVELPLLKNWVKDIDQYEFFIEEEEVFALPLTAVDKYVFAAIKAFLNIKTFGVNIGKIKNNKFIPSHHLAVSQLISEKVPSVEVNYEQAINYLKKLEVQLETDVKGWCVITYEQVPLGWVKVLPNRVNNLYPIELRIKKNFEV